MSKAKIGFFVLIITVLAFGSILLAACARPGTPAAATNNGGGNSGGGGMVHMGNTNFVTSTVSISKGTKVTLIDDAAVPHIIKNGTYDANNNPHPKTESGAPTVDASFQGNDMKDIGPFTTKGIFHVYCTIHAGMQLTITVN